VDIFPPNPCSKFCTLLPTPPQRVPLFFNETTHEVWEKIISPDVPFRSVEAENAHRVEPLQALCQGSQRSHKVKKKHPKQLHRTNFFVYFKTKGLSKLHNWQLKCLLSLWCHGTLMIFAYGSLPNLMKALAALLQSSCKKNENTVSTVTVHRMQCFGSRFAWIRIHFRSGSGFGIRIRIQIQLLNKN
jgi:hypothetical protein